MIVYLRSLSNFEHLLTLHQLILDIKIKIESLHIMKSIY